MSEYRAQQKHFWRPSFIPVDIFFKYLVPAIFRIACCARSIARSWIIAEPNLQQL